MKLEYVRNELVNLLDSPDAHLTLKDIVARFPAKLLGVRPAGAPHSAWELIEHLRIAQSDILEFTRNANYKELKFPDDYWPSTAEPPNEKAWDKSIAAIEADR